MIDSYGLKEGDLLFFAFPGGELNKKALMIQLLKFIKVEWQPHHGDVMVFQAVFSLNSDKSITFPIGNEEYEKVDDLDYYRDFNHENIKKFLELIFRLW